MDNKLEMQGSEPRQIHHALFGREVVVKSVDDLVANHHQSRFATDPVGVVEQMSERELRDFVDLYGAHADVFEAGHIRQAFTRRGNEEAELPWSDNEDIGLASEIANQLHGEFNRKFKNANEDTPLLRVLFPQ